jgi:hypothetical protein
MARRGRKKYQATLWPSPSRHFIPSFSKNGMGKIEDPHKLNFFTPPTALERSRWRGGRYACAGGRGGIGLF